jgi:hypothetical protein
MGRRVPPHPVRATRHDGVKAGPPFAMPNTGTFA